MQNLHLLLYSLVALFVSFFLFRSAAGSLAPNKPNMISFIFYKSIILQTFIASILAILYLDNHYVISTVTDSARYYGWLATNYLIIAMPAGMLLAKFIFTRKVSMKSLLSNYTKQEINLALIGKNSLKYSIWTFTLISIFACIYTFYIMGYYPPLKIFNVSPEVAAELRGTATRNFGGNVYIRNFFAITMMPIMSYIWCFYFIKSKNILDLILFTLTFIFSISILYYNFAKAPILSYILSYIFVYFYAKGKINKTLGFIAVSLVLILLVYMYLYTGNTLETFLKYNSGPVGRIILSQAAGLFMMFDYFPDQHSFLGLSSLSRLISSLFGYEYVDNAARLIMKNFNPQGVEDGVAGVMSTIFIGEAWANFGLPGVLLAPIWVGFVIQTVSALKSASFILHYTASN